MLITSLIQCQKKDNIMESLPKYNVQVCHPNPDYGIDLVSDKIKTLEDVHATLPYGGSSGRWGDSGKGWTEQYGTPIGADIVYYAGYEDTFYHLDVDFPVEKMKEMVRRAYAMNYVSVPPASLQEYIITNKNLSFDSYNNPYDGFSDLVFGFAPKGMVVVWLWYGGLTAVEVGRYQAQIIKDDKELEEKLFADWGVKRDEVRRKWNIPNASPKEWDDYRIRYNWRPILSAEDNTTFMITYTAWYYNGEKDTMLRPWILSPENRDRAVPKEIQFFWRAGGVQYEGRVFFKWEKMDKILKEKGKTKNDIRFHINKDNKIEVFLNDEPLEVESIRVYGDSNIKFQI